MSKQIVIRSGPDRLRYTLLFEMILVSLFSLGLAKVFGRELLDVGGLAVVMSLVAMLVNLIYNFFYDRIDVAAGRIPTERSAVGRLLHAVLFELCLLVMFIPLTMTWLGLSVLEALLMNTVAMGAVVVYTLIFTWAYDRIFPAQQPATG